MRKRKLSVWSILYMIALLGLPTALTVGLVLDPEYTFTWVQTVTLISLFLFGVVGSLAILIIEGIILPIKSDKP